MVYHLSYNAGSMKIGPLVVCFNAYMFQHIVGARSNWFSKKKSYKSFRICEEEILRVCYISLTILTISWQQTLINEYLTE